MLSLQRSTISNNRRSVLSAAHSGASTVKTSKTYINSLEQRLNEERDAREMLQREIENLKKINSEISSKLGISHKQ